MTTVLDSDFYIPELPEDAPTDTNDLRDMAIKFGYQRALECARVVTSLKTKIQKAKKKRREQLIQLIDIRKHKQWREYIAKENRILTAKRHPADGSQMSSVEMRKMYDQRQRDSLDFLQNLDVQYIRINALNKKLNKSLAKFAPKSPIRQGEAVRLVTTSNVPLEVRNAGGNPWTVVEPPYPGWAWHYSGEVSGFNFDHPTLYLDSTAGFVGNRNNLADWSSGDDDHGAVDYITSIGFWYKMPSTGLIEVWIEAYPYIAKHWCFLLDEFGWSYSSVSQYNYLTLRANGLAGRSKLALSETFSWSEEGKNNGDWFDNDIFGAIGGGDARWGHLFSDITYPAGQWVYLEVGTQNSNFCLANDVTVVSDLEFKWFIKSVKVNSTGG